MVKNARWRYVAMFMTVVMVFNLLLLDFKPRTVKAYDVAASVTNAIDWDAAAMLATINGDADNGLQLFGGFTLGDDATGAANWGLTDGGYAKAANNGVKTGVPDSGDYFKFTAPEDGKLVVCEKTNKGKLYNIVDAQGTVVAQADNSAGTASSYDTLSVELKKGDVVYGYCGGSKAAIFHMSFEPVQLVRTWNAAAMLATINGDADNGLQLFGGFTLGDDATGAANWGLTDGGYAKAANNGVKTGVPDSGDYFKFMAPEDGKLVVCEKTNKGKLYNIVDAQGAVVAQADNSAGTASSYDTLSVELKKGDVVYGYCGGSKAAIFQIRFEMGEKTVTPWADVPDPVIKDVKVNEEGNFEVAFDCAIDEYSGADSVEVIAMYNNGEAGSVVVTNDSTKTVVITPNWSGDYSFFAIARRAGEGEKRSESVDYNGYVLAVKKPVIIFADNKGDGKVYLDWINLSDADYYRVSYKKTSDDEFTVAEADNKAGNALVTLSEGVYDIKIEAVRSSDGFVSNYVLSGFEVSAPKQVWNLAIVGSSQEAFVNIDGTDYHLDVQDNHELVNLIPNVKPLNETSNVTVAASNYGKIADAEDGEFLYYTFIDPNTENFKLSAKFTITDNSLTPDNQTGFGVMAADMLGINYWGKPDYKHKYFNSVSAIHFKGRLTLRSVSGYTSSDTMNNEGVTRTNDYKNFSATYSTEVGTSYVIALEKTDAGFTATCDGQELNLDKNIVTAVQEDGSMLVGVMVSRKIGVEITDVTFEKSASKGVVGAIEEKTVTPSMTVFSSNACGADDYVFTATVNTAGHVFVYDTDGNVVFDEDVAADDVVRANVPISVGDNKISAKFVPDDGDQVTKEVNVKCQRYLTFNDVLYVSPDGSADGDGTIGAPLDIKTATTYARPGQTVYLLNGKYGAVTIQRSSSGTSENAINLFVEKISSDGEDGVVFDGPLTIVGSYWHVYGIYVKDSSGVGIQISGNYNIVARCTADHSAGTGIQISRSGSANNTAGRVGKLWPSYNVVINCDSFDNCDALRNDADGFAAKLTVGDGNVFYGCIAYNNIDDGWDLYAKGTTGSIGAVAIMNCITYNNGYLTTDDITAEGYNFGEGNGFKLGGEDLSGKHLLVNSLAFHNHGKGITSNSCPDDIIINCTSYGNQISNNGYNVGLNTRASNLKAWEVEGLISLNVPENTTTADLIPSSLHSGNNYIYNGEVSVNANGTVIGDDIFVSTDISKLPERDAYGRILTNGLFELKDKDFGSGSSFGDVEEFYYLISDEFSYEIIEGANQEIELGSEIETYVKSSAEMLKFESVSVDDVILDENAYAVTEGSTVVTFSKEFISSLTEGEHTITVNSTDGSASTVFKIFTEAASDPVEDVPTGDSANYYLYFMLMACALTAMAVVFKKVNSNK